MGYRGGGVRDPWQRQAAAEQKLKNVFKEKFGSIEGAVTTGI